MAVVPFALLGGFRGCSRGVFQGVPLTCMEVVVLCGLTGFRWVAMCHD